MKKIKILRIIARLNIGGPAIHTILLTEGLDKSRFESLLVCGRTAKDEGDMTYYILEKNVMPIFIPELKRKLHFFNDLVAFKKIYNIIKTEQPDIIHTHTAKAGALGRLAGIFYNCLRFFRKRTILIHTFHGHVFEGYFNKMQTLIFISIERFLAIFTNKVITVSECVKNELLALHISRENKIEVIPLGLELGRFLQIAANENAVSNIGIVGRLVPIKNHRLFLEAAAMVIKDNPCLPVKFKIIGDGELKKDLEEYAQRLNINNWVDFLGWQNDLAGIYANLDVVALTSMNEGTPVSLIEAMASGRAVVATGVGGVRDLLGKEISAEIKTNANFRVMERGIIVEPGDSFSFAAAITFILQNNSVRKNIQERGRDFAKDRFTRERLIRDVENLYNKIAISFKL